MDLRKKDFSKIMTSLAKDSDYSSSKTIVCGGDSLEVLRKIPTGTVSLILTDPPYHSTKKKNIIGDTNFKTDEEFISWMKLYIKEWKRVLRPNGSIFCYCSSSMASKIEIAFSEEFNVLSHIVWTKPNAPGFDGWKQKMKKESLRQWYDHTERIIFAEPACEGNLHKSPFAHLLRELRTKCELTSHELTELTGAYGKVNHGGAVSNWETGRNVPSREQYEKICTAFLKTGKIKKMPHYNDVIRPFNVNSSVEFTDVWNFQTVRPYKGKHPAEKPLDMLVHAIEATTYEGDIVMDCFAGSGNTSLAAIQTKRRSIAIEIDQDLVNNICEKVEAFESDSKVSTAMRKKISLEQPSFLNLM